MRDVGLTRMWWPDGCDGLGLMGLIRSDYLMIRSLFLFGFHHIHHPSINPSVTGTTQNLKPWILHSQRPFIQ